MLEKLYACALYGVLGVTAALLGATTVTAQGATPPPGVTIELESAELDALQLRFKSDSPRRDRVMIGDRELPALALDGAGFLQDPGYPLVPHRRVLVEIPPEVEVQLSVSVELEEALGQVRLLPVPRLVPDLTTGTSTARAVPFADSRGTLPANVVRLEYVGWLRHRRVACLEYTPVRFDPATGEARVARELRVALHFTGPSGAAGPAAVVDGPWFDSMYEKLLVNPGTYYTTTSSPSTRRAGPSATAGPLLPPATGTDVRWRLKVEADERGLYQITPADLQAAGIDPTGVDPRQIGMSRRGAATAVEVEGEADGSFDAGDRVLFYADPEANRYREVNAWWVFEVLSGPGAGAHAVRRMQTVDGTPQSGDTPVPFFRDTVRAETSLKYWQTMPNGTGHDHWYWKRNNAPATNDYAITAPHPEPGGSNIRVRAALHGFTDTSQDPDHHTRLSLNGTQIDDASWNGMVPYLHDVSVSAAQLQDGSNTIRVQQLLDLGAIVAGLYSDWFEIEYDRDFVADGDELLWTSDSTQVEAFAVDQLTSQTLHALVVTDANDVVRIVNAQLTGSGGGYLATFRHAVNGGQQYFLATEPAVRSPLSVAAGSDPIPVPLLGADLLIVAEDQFASALAPLVQLREQNGLRVSRVSPQAIYDAYSHGEFDPEAIQSFVQDAFLNWRAPAPSFLMLVGEASLDFRDYWGSGPWNSAPGYLYQTDNDLEIPSDHLYVTVAGGDVLPDLYVGRLPAADAAEAATLVSKILTYETSPPAGSWQTEVVHIADYGGQFINALMVAATLVPPTHSVTEVYADVLGGGTHGAILSELSQGCVIGTYFGHGAVYNWGASLLDNGDIGGLSNGSQLPLINALNCLNGFYAIYKPPGSPPRCLAEEFLLEPGGGAIACIAPSGLGATWEYQRLLGHLYGRVFAGESLGQAQTGAKVDAYLIDAVDVHNLWSCVLFGDPSAPLLLP